MDASIDASQEMVEAELSACVRKTETSQERREDEIKICLEEMKATDLEAIEEAVKVVIELQDAHNKEMNVETVGTW
jgi:hypothetical protein